MATENTLSWILPFVRESLRGRSNFSFDQYADGLWAILEKAHVPGVQKRAPSAGFTGFNYDFAQTSPQLRDLATEAFFYLVHNGFIVPDAPSSSSLFRGSAPYRVSARGLEWASGGDPLPEDYDGYLALLHALVPNLGPVIDQYVSEGLSSFVRGTYFAAAVMMGAASEKAVYLLAESMLDGFRDPGQRARLTKLLEQRKFNSLFSFVEDAIAQGHSTGAIPYEVAEGSSRHLLSLLESIRVQRNDAVHPMNAQVSAGSVRHSFSALPHTLEKVENTSSVVPGKP